MAKRGLKVRDVAKDHFSSGVTLSEPPFSRLVIRFLEGKDLLASDIETGKSDPVSFVWCGPIKETINLEEADFPESGILRTSVCRTTINPIWNEDVIFPLDVTEIKSFNEMKCLIYVRDEDPHPDSPTTYDELGMLELPFKDIISKGKALKNSIVISGTWYTLGKSPGMRKVDGQVKLTLSLIFSPEDDEVIQKQLPNPPANTNFTRSSINQLNSVSQKVQRFLTNPAAMEAEASLSKVDPRLRLSMSSLGRPSSAKMSSRSTFSIASIAPMVRRPATAPQKRAEERSSKEKETKGRNRSGGSRGAGNTDADNMSELGDDEDLDEIIEEEDEEEGEEGEQDEEGEEGEVERGSEDESDELIVMKPKVSKSAPKQSKRYKNSSNSDSIGVEVGGYDLSELLQTDPENPQQTAQTKQTMEDIIRVGVNHITASLDNELFVTKGGKEGESGNDRAAAEKVARKIQSTAAEMAGSGAGQGETDDADGTELARATPTAGDEGVLEEVVKMGINNVTAVLQNADMQDVVKEGSKLVAKTAKAVAGDAAQLVKSAATRAANELMDPETGKAIVGTVAKAAKQQLQNIVNNPAETVVSLAVPVALALADNDKSKEKKILNSSPRSAPQGAPKPAASNTKAPAKVSAVDTTHGHASDYPDPDALSGENAYLSRMAGDEDDHFAAPLYAMGDQAANPEIEEDNESPEHTSPQKRARPISAPITLTPNSGALVSYDGGNNVSASHLQLQAELKQQAQGHATAVVRALKEMSTQRKIMEKSLEKIATATAAGFSKLSQRISHLEDALLTQQAHGQALGGDQLLPPEEEEAEVEERGRGRDRNSKGRGLNSTTPARIESKGRGASASSTSRGRANNTTGGNVTTNGTASKTVKKGATSTSPARRPNTAAGNKKDKDPYGNVGAIAAAKAQARANKKKQLHPPFATFEDSQASSGSASFHFQPPAQLMFRGSDGRVESSALAVQPRPESPNALQYQQQQQQQGMGMGQWQHGQGNHSPDRPNGFMSPTTNNTAYNSGGYNSGYHTATNSYTDGSSQAYGNNNPSNSYPTINSYYPTPNSNPYNPALQGSVGSGHSMQAALPHAVSGNKYPLNKEFSGVLERGSLQDIARLLESTAPRPEDLSASVRNRLYDAVATLLHQNSHTERCLMWVLALLRGPSALLNEVVGHTVRDLREALETVALEASKRGLLASLLKSQINR